MGNWIAVNGSRNPSHGKYTVNLDGTLYPSDGWTSEDTPFTESLFTSPALPHGNHTLIISNDEWTTLDIDSVRHPSIPAAIPLPISSDNLVLQFRPAQRLQLFTVECDD